MHALVVLLLAVLLPSVAAAQAPVAAAQSGRAVFDKACATCHFERRDPARMNEMAAPPMDMMTAHVRQAVNNDRAAFVQRVVSYIKAPNPDAAVDPMAIQRFGVMPSIRDTFPEVTDSDLTAVAGWLFDYYADVQLPAMEQRQMWRKQSQ